MSAAKAKAKSSISFAAPPKKSVVSQPAKGKGKSFSASQSQAYTGGKKSVVISSTATENAPKEVGLRDWMRGPKSQSTADQNKDDKEALLGKAPDPLFGTLMKKRGKRTTSFSKEYQERVVRVDGSRLYWWSSVSALQAQVGPDPCASFKGCLDLHSNHCEVVAIRGYDTRFGLRPVGGHWMNGEFDGLEEGREFVFDAAESEHDRKQWMHVIQEHIDFAGAEWSYDDSHAADGASSRTGGIVKVPKNWEFLESMMPTGRTEDDAAVRNRLFESMDINDNGRVGVIEVKNLLIHRIRIPGVKDYTPAVQCALKATREATRMHGAYGREWLNLHSFRILLFFLKHYIQLWVAFLSMNTNEDNRLDAEEFNNGATQLASVGVFETTKYTFHYAEKANPDYMRFDEFAALASSRAKKQDLVCYPDELTAPGVVGDRGEIVSKSQEVVDFNVIRDRFPLLRDSACTETRLKFWCMLTVDSEGYLSCVDVTKCVSKVLRIPGIGNYELAVRMAFTHTLESMELEGVDCRGVGWEAYYALVYFLHMYVELWVRFCMADSSGDLRVTPDEFASIGTHLDGWGLEPRMVDRLVNAPDNVFKEVDHDGSGYIRFMEFVDWCMQHQVFEIPLLTADPTPSPKLVEKLKAGAASMMSCATAIDWEAIGREFPSDFSAKACGTRRDLFNFMDNNGNGKLNAFEVSEALKSKLHMRVRDFTPAVKLAFVDAVAALPPDESEAMHDYCEEIGWREFRVFLLYLVRYLEIWVNYLSACVAINGERRVNADGFARMLPGFAAGGWGLMLDADRLADQAFCEGTYRKLVGKEEGLTYTQLAKWCVENSRPPNLHLSQDEVDNKVSQAPREQLEVGESGFGFTVETLQERVRAAVDKETDKVYPKGIENSLSKALEFLGLSNFEPPVRLAFEAVKPHVASGSFSSDGSVDSHFVPELTHELHVFLELWVMFSAADASNKGSITLPELAFVLPQLQEWGLEAWDAKVAFTQIDVYNNVGSVAFEDFAKYCRENHIGKFDDIGDDPDEDPHYSL